MKICVKDILSPTIFFRVLNNDFIGYIL